MTQHSTIENLTELAAALLVKARAARSGRTAQGVYGGKYLKQTMLALAAGSQLAEHDSPPEATLQVIRGAVELSGGDESWALRAGDLMAIPPQRHSVTATEDAVFLLSIRLDVTKA